MYSNQSQVTHWCIVKRGTWCLIILVGLQTVHLPKTAINAKDQANDRGRLGKNALWDISVGLYLKYCVMQSNISVVSKEPVINTIDFIQNPSEDAN